MSNDKKDAMPAWPNIDDYTFAGSWTDFSGAKHEIDKYADEVLYERALSAAWEARCRVAVEALQEIKRLSDVWAHDIADEAIFAIGPLPDLPSSERG